MTPLAYGKFQERRVPDAGPPYVMVRVYDGEANLHLDDEYALYRRTVAADIEALRAIVARLNDGWDYVKPEGSGRKGLWFRVQDGAGNWALTAEDHAAGRMPTEPMTEPEQHAIYGRIVTPSPAQEEPAQ